MTTGALRFELEASKAPMDEDLSEAERATFARLQISLAGTPLTRVVSTGGEPRDWVRGPMSGLAEWIVEQWVWLLWEAHTPFPKSLLGGKRAIPGLHDASRFWPDVDAQTVRDRGALGRWQLRHTLGVGASDLALPSISFLPEDRMIGVFVAEQAAALDPTVDFVAYEQEPAWLGADDLREVLANFTRDVLELATENGAVRWSNWLGELWAAQQAKEADPRERTRAALGEFAAARWDEASATLGPDAEALRGLLLDAPTIEDEAAWSNYVASVHRVSARQMGADAGLRALAPVSLASGSAPFRQGQQMAASFREELGNRDRPIDLRQTFEQIRLEWQAVDAPAFRSAVVRSQSGAGCVYFDRELGVAPRRFALAAALGRLLGARSDRPFGAAHGASSRYRESQRANAFAAELLLPAAALRGRGESDLDVLCDDFGISRSAASWQIKNRGGARDALRG